MRFALPGNSDYAISRKPSDNAGRPEFDTANAIRIESDMLCHCAPQVTWRHGATQIRQGSYDFYGARLDRTNGQAKIMISIIYSLLLHMAAAVQDSRC